MAKSLFVTSNSPVAGTLVVDNVTRNVVVAGGASATGTEINTEVPIRDSGTFQNLCVYVSANSNTVDGTTCTLRISEADTAIQVTINGTETGWFEDVSNTASFAATDEANYQIIAVNDASGSRSTVFRSMTIEFVADANTVTKYSISGSATFAGINRYFPPCQIASSTTTYARAQSNVQGTFTLSDMYAYVSANTRTGDAIWHMWINGSAGNQTFTVGSTVTGSFEDTSNTDSISAGDLINVAVDGGSGTGNMTVVQVSFTSISSANQFFMSGNDIAGNAIVAFNSTRYFPISGTMYPNSTVAYTYAKIKSAFTWSKLWVYIEANSIATSNSTLTSYINGSAGSQLLTVAAGATGEFIDTTNSDNLVADDLAAVEIICPNTSGSITFYGCSSLGEYAASVVVSKRYRMLMGVGS